MIYNAQSMNDADIIRALANVRGWRGIKDRILASVLTQYFTKVKNHFGISMNFDGLMSGAAIEWVKKHDPKFSTHIVNPYISKNKFNKGQPLIDGTFIVKLEEATYLMCSGRLKELQNTGGDMVKQYLTLYIFGKKTYKYYNDLTRSIEMSSNSSHILYSVSAAVNRDNSSYWSCTGTTLTPRTFDSLFFNADIKDKIINHLNKWVSNEKVYKERGLTFKTGILLYGKAGTGKSSLANVISNYLNCNMITIDTTTFNLLPIGEVTDAIVADECRYVVLIDEIDAIFKTREDENATDVQKANATKILSFLDSPQSPTNVVFVCTTNYIDRLDPALMRKGRIDLSIELTDIEEEPAREMCASFNMPKSQVDEMLKDVEFPINPATLQQMILENVVVS